MVEENKHTPVWFNQDQLRLFEEKKALGLTNRTFAEFVKDAFYDKLDSINIEQITQERIEALTKKGSLNG